MLTSPTVLAATEKTPWTTYFIIGMAISTIAATILSMRNKNAQGIGVKIMFGGVYFWIVSFAQLIVFAAISYFNK